MMGNALPFYKVVSKPFITITHPIQEIFLLNEH